MWAGPACRISGGTEGSALGSNELEGVLSTEDMLLRVWINLESGVSMTDKMIKLMQVNTIFSSYVKISSMEDEKGKATQQVRIDCLR